METVGAGFYVRADVATQLALSCDCCLATFEHPVQTQFEVRQKLLCNWRPLIWQFWYNGSAGAVTPHGLCGTTKGSGTYIK